MDLSKLSDADLAAVAANNMAGVSDAGLRLLAGIAEKPQGGFKAAFLSGLEGIKGAGYGLAGRTGLMDIEEAARKQEEHGKKAGEIFKPTEEGWTEAPWTKFKETLGGSLPYMAAPLAAGAAAAAPFAAGTAAATIAGMGAAGLASGTQFAATNLARQVEEDKGTGKTAAQKLRDTDLTSAIMAAPVQAAFDVFGLGKIPGIRQVIGAVAKDVGLEASKKIVGQTFKEAAIDYAKSTGKAIGAEGITEAAQQVLERMQAGLNITDANARKEYWENFVGGAVLGGAMAPAGRYMERRGEVAKEQAEAAKAKEAADLAAQQKAAEAAAARVKDPAYLDDLTARVDAFNKQKATLQDAVKGKVEPNDAVAIAQRKNDKAALVNFMRDDANQALLAELTPEVTQAIRRRQSEKAAAEQAVDEVAKPPLADYAEIQAQLEQVHQAHKEALATATQAAASGDIEGARTAQARVADLQDQIRALSNTETTAPPAPAPRIPSIETLEQTLAKLNKQYGVELLSKDKSNATALLAEIEKNQALLAKQRHAIYPPERSLGAEEQEADVQATQGAQQQQEAADIERERSLAPERNALRRIAAAPAVPLTGEQFGMFGPNVSTEQQRTPSSAPIGQMKQQLLGEDVTATAPSTERGPVQRGGPAPFKLYARREGTGEALTKDNLQQRVYELQKNPNLSDEAHTLLKRLETAIPEGNTTGIHEVIDAQLARIERGEEGVAKAGARKRETLQAFPVQGSADTTAPTLATKGDTTAKAPASGRPLSSAELQQNRQRRYQEGIEAGLSEAEARRRAYQLLPAQAEDASRTTTTTPAIPKQKIVDTTSKDTLRGPSTQPGALNIDPELETHLRTVEGLQQDNTGQKELFPETQKDVGVIRSSFANLMRYINSAAFKKTQADVAVKGAQAVNWTAKVKELTQKLQSMLDAQAKYRDIEGTVNAGTHFGPIEARSQELQEAMLKNMFSKGEIEQQIAAAQEHIAEINTQREALQGFDTQGWPGRAQVLDGRLKNLARQAEVAERNLQELQAANAEHESVLNKLDEMLKVSKARKDLPAARAAAPFPYEVEKTREELTNAQAAAKAEVEKKSEETTRTAKQRRADEAVAAKAAKDQAQRMSDERTRLWNSVYSGNTYYDREGNPLERTKHRALLEEERQQRGDVTPEEADNERRYASNLYRQSAAVLERMLGRVEKSIREATAAVNAAKERTGKYVGGAQNATVFRGLGKAIKLQALYATRRQAIEDALDYRRAVEEPRSTKRSPPPAPVSKQDIVQGHIEALQELGSAKDNLQYAIDELRGAKEDDASPELIAQFEGNVRRARERLEELTSQQDAGRGNAAGRTQSAAPSELRSASERTAAEKREARTNRKNPITEARTHKAEPLSKIVEEANAASEARGEVTELPGTAEIDTSSPQEVAWKKVQDLSAKIYAVRERLAAYRKLQKQNPDVLKRLEAEEKSLVKEHAGATRDAKKIEGSGKWHSSEGGDFTVLHADAREAILEGNITAALQNISTTAKSAIHRLIAAKLLPFVESTRVAVRQDIEPGGEYHHADNRILMHPNYLTEEHFLHEVLHAATLQVLSKPVESLSRSQRAARARLEGMYNRILVDSRFSGEYGKKHLNEFVAELHTNAGLREKLDSIGKPESLLKRIVRAITEFFTGPKDTPKESAVLMHAVETLFSESGYGVSGVHEKSKMAELGEDITEQRGTLQRAYEERSKFGLAARQAVADMRAALRETFSLGDKHTGIQAQSSLLAADSYIGNSQAVAEYGAPKIEKDSKGILRVVFGASKSGVDVMKAIGKIPAASAKERMNIFQGYVTALRAEEVGWDALSFDKAAEKQKAAKTAMAELDANPEMKKAVEAAHAVYRDLNRGMIDFLDATHALPADVVASMRAAKNYIPFYRVNGDNIELFMPDGHPRSIGDIRSLPFLHALDTGDQKLMDFPNAMMKNIALLTNLGVMNLTNRQIGYHLMSVGRTATTKEKPMQIRRGDGAGKNNVLRWIERPDPAYPKDDGQRYIILDTKGTAAEHIPTPLLTQAVAGSYATFPAMLEVAGTVSNLLRSGVTRVPLYAFKQLFKDAFNASVSGNLKSNPIKAVAQVVGNFANIMRGADVSAEALRKAGVLHSNVFSGGRGDLNKVALQMAGDQQGYVKRGLAYLDKLAMSADAAARTQAYKDALASGASEAEAVIHARELANFTRHGSESSVQFLARAIPFFNASIQGLDVLQRSMRGKMPASELYAAQEKFFNRAMGLAGVAMMYAFLMEDDPEWQRMSLRDKISYIHLPRMFGEKEPLRLPAPFETGMMFYSMPIAMYEAMKGEFTKKDWGVIKDVVLAQAPNSGSFMPLIGKGVYDVARNYNSGTGAPIVPKSKEGLDPIYQFNEKTTELAKRLAEGLNDAGVKLSPMELEYLSQTYLGGIPVAVATLSNGLFSRLRDDAIAKPTSKMSEMPFIGSMFQNQKGTDDIEHVYEIAERVKKVQNTISKLKNTGRPEDLREYLQEHKVEMALASPVGAFTKAMGTLQQNEEVVRNHPKMSAEAKSQRLDFLQEKKQEVAERLRAALTSAEKRLNASLQT